MLSLISGINDDLIKFFYKILKVISSDHDMNIQRLQEFELAEARKSVDLYPWLYFKPYIERYRDDFS